MFVVIWPCWFVVSLLVDGCWLCCWLMVVGLLLLLLLVIAAFAFVVVAVG